MSIDAFRVLRRASEGLAWGKEQEASWSWGPLVVSGVDEKEPANLSSAVPLSLPYSPPPFPAPSLSPHSTSTLEPQPVPAGPRIRIR